MKKMWLDTNVKSFIKLGICISIAIVLWMLTGYMGETLFSVSAETYSDLKSGDVPEDLRKSFTENGISLSEKPQLSVKQAGVKWLVNDGDAAYVIEKEKEKLNIYVGVNPKGWHIFSIFVAVIISLILRPFPMGAMVLFGLVAVTATKGLTIQEALSGYADKTVWLVVAAFIIAGAVVRTGFGRRVALILVSWLGKTTLGLGYAICGSELLLGPVVPSNTARGGGILAPIVDALSRALDSYPDKNPERAGRFLVTVSSHANLIVSAMFLTAMAANPILADLADKILDIKFGWGTWALGSIVPGLTGLLLLPLLIYYLAKPTLKDASSARIKAREELTRIGPWTRKEKAMGGTLIALLLLWIIRPFSMNSTLIAWMGISILVLTGTEKWIDIAKNDKAWDTLIWFGGLVTMATMLKEHGLIGWFADIMRVWVSGFDGIIVAIVLALIYFYSMYAFSMFTAHILAMAAAFFAVSLAAGAPAMLTVALFAYFSSLCGCLTNYSTGPPVMYFSLGYVPIGRWFSWGFIISFFHLAVWFGVGMVWWKILGWW